MRLVLLFLAALIIFISLVATPKKEMKTYNEQCTIDQCFDLYGNPIPEPVR